VCLRGTARPHNITGLHATPALAPATPWASTPRLRSHPQHHGPPRHTCVCTSLVNGRSRSLARNSVGAGLAFFQVVLPPLVSNAQLIGNVVGTRLPRSGVASTRFAAVQEFLRQWGPALKDAASLVERWHLAVFYLSGIYYSLAYRLIKIR
jgi:hypothetical protein